MMKTAIPSNTKDTQNPTSISRRPLPRPHSGPLAQLAAMMNQSPRVQAQLKLADEIQNSEPVQRQMALADEINQAQTSVTQPRLKEDENPGQRKATFATVQRKSATGTIQLVLDAESKLPAEEQGNVDNLLRHNGHDPSLYTAVDYQTLAQLYGRLRGLDTKLRQNAGSGPRGRRIRDEQEQARQDIPGAYQAVRDSARDLELRAGNAAWGAAVTAGADAYVANRPGGYAAAAGGAWVGRGAMPAAFQNAVQAEVTARDRAVEAAFQAYQDNNRLLAGTINAIKRDMGAYPTLAAVNARLLTVYHRQTEVSRDNWLTHLGIAGRNTTPGNPHYTTFNDAVSNPVVGRVDNQTVQQLMDMLFVVGVPADRIHATHVVGGTRYHKYYGGNYSANVPLGFDTTTLDREYDRMIATMQARVQAAKNVHGRVGNNDRAQNLNIGP